MLFQFIGQSERIYPDIVIEGKVLVAQPGDQHRFPGEPPRDGLWVEAAPPVKRESTVTKAPAKES